MERGMGLEEDCDNMLSTFVDIRELEKEVGMGVEAGNGRRERGVFQEEGNEDAGKNLCCTSLLIDWDRRVSCHIEQKLMSEVALVGVNRREGNAVVGNDRNVDNGDSGYYEGESFIKTYTESKWKDVAGISSTGISKLRQAGRYKYKYAVNEVEMLQEIATKTRELKERYVDIGKSVSNVKSVGLEEGNAPGVEFDVEPVENVEVGVGSSDNVGSDVRNDDDVTRATRLKLRSQGLIPRDRKPAVRKKKRERVNASKFRLTDLRRKPRRSIRMLSEEEWICQAFKICKILMGHLEQKWIEVPHLRCLHMKQRSRRLLSVCTARIRVLGDNEQWKEVITVAFMVEQFNKDVTCLNVLKKTWFSRSGTITGMNEVITCSCSVQREGGVIIDSTCVHTTLLRDNSDILDAIRATIKNGDIGSGQDEGDNKCFGSWVIVSNGCATVDGEMEEPLICTQVDQSSGADLTERGKNIARRWSCWNVLDVDDGNFICCIRTAVGTGVQVTKLKCTQCRMGSERKCRHESACAKVLSDTGSVTLNENGELQEVIKSNDVSGTPEIADDSDSEYSESDEECQRIGERTACRGVPGENEGLRGKCLNIPNSFLTSTKSRPLYMCEAEKRMTQQLSDHIEMWERVKGGISFTDPDGWICGGVVADENGSQVSCNSEKQNAVQILPRKVTLFTLNHDLLSVVMNDWVCPSCGYENRYCGEAHGIYPAAKHRAFTVELMYYWMHQSMGSGVSFRSVFELTCNLQNTPSYRRKFDTGRIDLLAPEFKRDRRLSNEAMRVFCRNVDLFDSSVCTEQLFSCKKCEVDITSDDCMQLGIDSGQLSIGLKRFNALVMDGKVISALRDFPIMNDEVTMLKAAKGLPSKILNNRDTRNALSSFTKGLRRAIRAVEYGRGREVISNFTRKDGKYYFRLGSLMEVKGVTKSNHEHMIKLSRWFCDRTSCLCSGSSWCEALGHGCCMKDRMTLVRKSGCLAVSATMGRLFGICGDGVGGEAVVTGTSSITRCDRQATTAQVSLSVLLGETSDVEDCENDDALDAAGDSSENTSAPTRRADVKNAWVYFKIDDWIRCTEVMERLLENIQFAYGEPVTLGFLPYYPAKSERNEIKRSAVVQEWGKKYLGVVKTKGICAGHSFVDEDSLRKQAIDLLSMGAEAEHRKVSTMLVEFWSCRHKGSTGTTFPCSECTKLLDTCTTAIQQQNTILAFLLQEIVRVGRKAPVLSRTACLIAHDLIDAKVAAMQTYKTEAASKMDKSVSAYWSKYGHYCVDELEKRTDGSDTSVFVFPGRSLLRPPIRTDVKDKPECTKKYYKSRPNMTSFISLQCPCRHPKIICFTLIREVESIAMAISTVLSFLQYPPRTLWYDNACNLYDSALIRTPFLLRCSTLVVDRFHYQGHTCSNHYNPNRYNVLSDQRSVAAEVLNAVLDKSAGFIRYLKGDNIKPYLRILFAIHNFTGMVKDHLNRDELPLLDFGVYYNDWFKCQCPFCMLMSTPDAWEYSTLHSVTFERIHGIR